MWLGIVQFKLDVHYKNGRALSKKMSNKCGTLPHLAADIA